MLRKLLDKLGWWIFCVKYKLGLAKEGIDFITVEDTFDEV